MSYDFTTAEKGSIYVGSGCAVMCLLWLVYYIYDELHADSSLLLQSDWCKSWRRALDAKQKLAAARGGAASKPKPQQFSDSSKQKSWNYQMMFVGRVAMIIFSFGYLLTVQLQWLQPASENACLNLNIVSGFCYYLSRASKYLFLILRFKLVAIEQFKWEKLAISAMLATTLLAFILGMIQTFAETADVDDDICDTNPSDLSRKALLGFEVVEIIFNISVLAAFIFPLRSLMQHFTDSISKAPRDNKIVKRKASLIEVIRRNVISCFSDLVISLSANFVYYNVYLDQYSEPVYNAANYLTSFDIIIHVLGVLYTHKRFRYIVTFGLYCWVNSNENDREFSQSASDQHGSILRVSGNAESAYKISDIFKKVSMSREKESKMNTVSNDEESKVDNNLGMRALTKQVRTMDSGDSEGSKFNVSKTYVRDLSDTSKFVDANKMEVARASKKDLASSPRESTVSIPEEPSHHEDVSPKTRRAIPSSTVVANIEIPNEVLLSSPTKSLPSTPVRRNS